MSYCMQSDLEKRFGEDELIQLTDREHLGEINAEVLAGALADACATIDSYLQQAYTLPLAQPLIDASPLKRICGDIVRYYLMDDAATDKVQHDHDKALAWLRDIAAGRASLGAQDTRAESQLRLTTAQGVSEYDWVTY